MKVVLDTNVLVSGLKTRSGTCARIVDLLVEGYMTAVVDGRIVDEYERVCMEPRLGLDRNAVGELLRFIQDCAEKVVPRPLSMELPDPDDLPFIEVAGESGGILVTGNIRHFPEGRIGDVKVVSPAVFLEMLRL